MEFFEILGILAAYAAIILIDRPRLAEAENVRKCKKVYYSLAAAGLVIGVLKTLGLIPYYDAAIMDFYKKLFGNG